jgi:hypothetical protein
MTDEQLAAMHRLLAEHHRKLAKEASLDVVQQYHADLAGACGWGRADTKAQSDLGTPSWALTTKTGDGDVDKWHVRLLDEGHSPAKLERATASLRDLWRSRLAWVND